MVSTVQITFLLLMVVRKLISGHRKSIDSFFYYLAPPKRPERFNSREELKRYLQKVDFVCPRISSQVIICFL
jgi:hypothetical protein